MPKKKKSAGQPKKLSPKTKFVLALPMSMSAVDVVKRSKEAGFTVSPAHVYKIRADARNRLAKGNVAAPSFTAPAAAVGKVAPAKRLGKVSKTQFVLGIALDKPAAQVVALAKAAGLSLTEKYVYNIRSSAKSKGKLRAAPKLAAAARVETITSIKAPVTTGTLDARFVELVLEVGLGRAVALMTQLKEQLKAIRLG